MAFLPTIYPLSLQKKQNESDQPCLVQHLQCFVFRRMALFTEFVLLSSDDVAAATARLTDKSSTVDPIPVSVLKSISDAFMPFLTHLFNHLLATGCVPASLKDSFIMPILKKSGMDEASPLFYGPISSLSVISKLLERLVMRQLNLASSKSIQLKLHSLGSSRCCQSWRHRHAWPSWHLSVTMCRQHL